MKKHLKIWAPRFFLLLVGLSIGYCVAPAEPTHNHDGDETSTTWTCSMHPQIQASESGSCPICGMDLIPATSGKSTESDPTEIVLSKRANALAQIRTTPVRRLGDGIGQRELVGQVARNQNKTRLVTAWFGGRIDRMRVSAEGERVKRGQTIAQMYSPEIYSAHNDLLIASSQLTRLKDAEPFARRAVESAAEASKTKLRLLGLRDSEIERMANADKAWTSVPVRSPFAGTVIRKLVDEGAYVQAGAPLLELSDLSTLWIELDAYASDVPSLSVGQRVTFTVGSIPGQTFQGDISFIEPVIDSATRTAKVRVDIENDGLLKPGQYVKASIESMLSDATTLVIPATAPLYAGKRSIVYIKTSDGRYVSREITIGSTWGDQVVVTSGISEDDVVVTHGAFTLDADLQQRNGLSLMARPDDRQPPKPPLTIEEKGALVPLWVAYLAVSSALARDDFESAKTSAIDLQKQIVAHATPSVSVEGVKNVIAPLVKTTELATFRVQFESLTGAFADLLEQHGNPTDAPIRYAFCPMAFDNRGAFWFQSDAEIKNVYFGSEMLACGDVKTSVPPGSSFVKEPK